MAVEKLKAVSIKAILKIINFAVSAILISAAAFLVYVAVPYFGNKALIVRSGSMQPAIGVGDLVVVNARKPVAAPAPSIFPKYKIGDIVAFSGQKDTSTITTHRIVDTKAQDGKILYQTKGDANDSPDSGLVAEDKILGKSAFKIPALGKIFALAKTRDGFLALVIVPALLVIIFEVINIIREIGNIRRRKHGSVIASNSTSGNILMRLLVPIVVGVMFFQESFASYADTAVSAGNLIQAAVSFASPTPSPTPSSPCPTTSGPSVVINEIEWVGSNGDGLDEWIELCNTTNSAIDLTNWVVEKLGTGEGPNANVVIPSGIIGANGFFIISNNDRSNSSINVPPDLVDTNVSLNNGGGQIVFKNKGGGGNETANGTGDWFEGDNSTPKKSMERKTPVGDGTQAASWQTATTHTNMDASGPTDEFATPKAANGL